MKQVMTQDMKRNIQTTDYRRLRSRSVGFAARTLFACYQRDARIRQQRVSGFAIRMLLLMVMMTVGATGAWGANADYWYFIVNKSGKIVNYAKANQSTTTVANGNAIPAVIKSVNASNWKLYNGDQIASTLNIVIPQITKPNNSYLVDCSTWGDVTLGDSPTPMSTLAESGSSSAYPNYIFVFSDYLEGSVPDINNGTYYTFRYRGNDSDPKSYAYYNGTKIVNTGTTSSVTIPENGTEYYWCFKANVVNGKVDPYDVKVYNSSVGYGVGKHFVANPTVTTSNQAGDGPESDNNVLTPAGDIVSPKMPSYYVVTSQYNSNDYNIIGKTAYNTQQASTKSNIYYYLWAQYQLNGGTESNKTKSGITAQGRFQSGGDRQQWASIILTRVNYTYIIVDGSGNQLVAASTSSSTLEVPDQIKSPLASYTYYGSVADAIAGTPQLNSLPADKSVIYVRYTTNNSLDLNGGTQFFLATAENFQYADNTAIGTESTVVDNTDPTRMWKLTGNDAYQVMIQNVDNNQYITCDVSSGEAVPTLSSSGSKFFLHEGTDGKYEVVTIPTNYSPFEYYTLGVASNTLKFYSSNNYALGSEQVQTAFGIGFASVTTAPSEALSLTYNASAQDLISAAGVAANGTMQYSLGDEDHFTTTIPTASDAGTYTVYYRVKGNSGYFDTQTASVEVTIAKASLTVTAASKTKEYGEADPALTFTTSGLQGTDTEADALSGSLTRATGEDVGTYAINQGGLTSSSNYTISYIGNNLTITAAPLSVAAVAQTKVYGEADPALTYSTTGFKFGDTAAGVLSGALSRATGNNVGTYAIEQGTLASNSNYTISYTGANLTITPKSLTSSDITLNITRSGNSYTVTVEDGNNTLNEGAGNDYTLGSTGDSSTKYYVATISGANNYSGSVSSKFVNVDFHPNSSNNEWTSSFVIGSSEGAFATPTGYTAHIVTGASGNVVTAPSLSYIPEGAPVILLSTASSNGFMAQPTSGAVPDVTGNKLAVASGTDVERTFTAGQIYILYNGEFVLNAAGTLAAGKIYLPKSVIVSGSTPAPSRLFIDWGESTGLNNSQFSTLNSQLPVVWYTLDGRRINGKPMKKGLYLRNGQKIVVR